MSRDTPARSPANPPMHLLGLPNRDLTLACNLLSRPHDGGRVAYALRHDLFLECSTIRLCRVRRRNLGFHCCEIVGGAALR
jgi:hypothetical protein